MDFTDAIEYVERLRAKGELPKPPFVLGPFAGAVGDDSSLREAPQDNHKEGVADK